jgi:site-specific DNA-methyltransferase (adenine-specific)
MPKSAHNVRLSWPGKRDKMPEVEAELELVRRGDPRSVLIQGDNLQALSALKRRPLRAALVYLDPPFFTGREHSHVERSKGRDGIVRRLVPAFDDRWPSLQDYLAELADRITVSRELLDEAGCLVLHVDPKTSHYAKVLCDEIFGPSAFMSEIIWRYRRWPAKTRNFQRVHDVLLRYAKNPDVAPRFRQLYEPLAPSTEKTWGTRKQQAVVDDSGRRRRSSVTREASPGAPLGDVWDISIVAPVARERTGYPTQKPEALIERLVEACTEPGDWVIDPYTGSGTTLAVCARLGRNAIGIDKSPPALEISRRRLAALGCEPTEQRLALSTPSRLPGARPRQALPKGEKPMQRLVAVARSA